MKIEERVLQLKKQFEMTDSSFDKEKLEERIGKLSGGIAVVRVGAPTESAQKELKQRVEDAVAATKAAMEEGIVPGGGIALANIAWVYANKVKSDKNIHNDAFAILTRALESPLRAIIENSGRSADEVIRDIGEERSKIQSAATKRWRGFNALTNKVEDLKKTGIIDPLKVTKTAFLNAVSVAANYLTIGAAVTDIPKKEESSASDMPPMGGGMPMGY